MLVVILALTTLVSAQTPRASGAEGARSGRRPGKRPPQAKTQAEFDAYKVAAATPTARSPGKGGG